MDFAWSAEETALRADAGDFANEMVATYGRFNDSWINGYVPEVSRRLSARHWIGMGWPAGFSGRPRRPVDRIIVAEELIAAGVPVGATWIGDRQIGPALIAFGSAQQRAQHLPAILAGLTTWCLGMSEPDAGSDLASLRTQATRRDDSYVISGRKIWTSFAEQADFCYLIARTTPSSSLVSRNQRNN